MNHKIIQANCLEYLTKSQNDIGKVDLTFLDPPFNQKKDYNLYNDDMVAAEYWEMMTNVSKQIYDITADGGAIYFMQREKNTEHVLKCLRDSEWQLKNLIIWKKKTSAVPCYNKYGMHYQIIAYAVKGNKARVFNKLRISPPLPTNYKHKRTNGVFVTDVWDDIRELTSGYFAGDEAIRKENGDRVHKQQSPIALLLRILLSSSNVGDTIFDPFAGTGTTSIVANQLQRKSYSIEIDPENIKCINSRLKSQKKSDDIIKYYKEYKYTPNLQTIWPSTIKIEEYPSITIDIFSYK